MANSEGPVGQPPAAWVWSHYRGVVADAHAAAPATAAAAQTPKASPEHEAPAAAAVSAPVVSAAAPDAKNSSLIGVGIAAAILVIAGLTWLFTSQPASSPAPTEPAAATGESSTVKSDSAPPAAAQSAASAQTPAAPDAPKTPAPAAHDHPGKKKKH